MPTGGFSTKPLKVKLLEGEQKATEKLFLANCVFGCFPSDQHRGVNHGGDPLRVFPLHGHWASELLFFSGFLGYRIHFTFYQ